MIHPVKRRKQQVEGGGPVGCGCGFVVAFGLAFMILSQYGAIGFWGSVGIAAVAGGLTWVFGEVVLEKMLLGPSTKTWWLWW